MPCADFEALLKRLDTEVAEKGTPPDESLQGEASLGYILIAEEDEAYRRELRSLFGGRYQIAETATGQETLGFIIRFEREISAVVLSLTLRRNLVCLCRYYGPEKGTGRSAASLQ